MADGPDASVRFTMSVHGTFEINGDYMRNANLQEFLDWAQKESEHFEVYVKEGSQEPRRLLNASVRVEAVHVVPMHTPSNTGLATRRS